MMIAVFGKKKNNDCRIRKEHLWRWAARQIACCAGFNGAFVVIVANNSEY